MSAEQFAIAAVCLLAGCACGWIAGAILLRGKRPF